LRATASPRPTHRLRLVRRRQLVLTYTTSSASWTPHYDLRLDTAHPARRPSPTEGTSLTTRSKLVQCSNHFSTLKPRSVGSMRRFLGWNLARCFQNITCLRRTWRQWAVQFG
jgi:hypothetical protein